MKRRERKLKAVKLVIARISNLDSIQGGITGTGCYSIDKECDLTTRDDGTGNTDPCESRSCGEIFA